jgi:AraC-like DNA-binding protein
MDGLFGEETNRTERRKQSLKDAHQKAPNSVSDGMIVRRETSFLPDGTYLFEDDLEIRGTVTARVITCTGWLLELCDLEAGELFFSRGKTDIRPKGKRFGVCYPPFTIARLCFINARGSILGLAGTAPLPAGNATAPFIFETMLPRQARPAAEILKEARSRQSIDANPNASSLSIKAKKLIGETRSSYPSIARIAARLGVSNAHLSRQFRRDYGMSPREYLHQLRIADAPLQLARGDAIADISLDSGYGDLSRFYKQFGKATKSSPGRCRKIVAPTRHR